jgi:hypothetical protein
MAKYLACLHDYPRETAGRVLAPSSIGMTVSTFLTTWFHRRSLRHYWLLAGAAFTTTGAFSNAGTPTVDAGSTLTVSGNFTQSSTGHTDRSAQRYPTVTLFDTGWNNVPVG